MKFINFSHKGNPSRIHVGAGGNTRWLDVSRAIDEGVLAFPKPVSSMDDVLGTANGLQLLETEILKLEDSPHKLQPYLSDEQELVLLAPILRPTKVIGIGLNYRDHAEETKITIPKSPLLFGMYANAIIGPESSIVIPPETSQVDYEAELAVIIGSTACRVSRENALDYVAGYTNFNDVSARDLQFTEKQWTRGKSIDTFAPMGPWMVTRSELGDASGLVIQARVNGQTLQKSHTGNLIFDVAALVSHISQTMTLVPGDVIATGTPSGVGYVRNPPIFLKPGDTVEIEIEKIGILRNPVVGLNR